MDAGNEPYARAECQELIKSPVVIRGLLTLKNKEPDCTTDQTSREWLKFENANMSQDGSKHEAWFVAYVICTITVLVLKLKKSRLHASQDATPQGFADRDVDDLST